MARQVSQKLSPQQRRRRLIKWTVAALAALLLLAVVVALALYLQTTGQPPMPRDAVRGIEQGGGSASLNAMAQVAQVQDAIQHGRRQQVHLQLTNADVSQLIGLGGVPGDVQDPQVYFGSGRVIARGRVEYGGRRLNLQAAIALTASGGQLQGTITEMWIGSLEAPAAVRQQMQEQLSAQLARQTPERFGLYVETISIQPGQATITGHTVGR